MPGLVMVVWRERMRSRCEAKWRREWEGALAFLCGLSDCDVGGDVSKDDYLVCGSTSQHKRSRSTELS